MKGRALLTETSVLCVIVVKEIHQLRMLEPVPLMRALGRQEGNELVVPSSARTPDSSVRNDAASGNAGAGVALDSARTSPAFATVINVKLLIILVQSAEWFTATGA